MGLEGSLKEFNLADILQLLFFQRKTGVLMLQGRFDKLRLFFNEGNITGVESRKRDVGMRLKRMLVGQGFVGQEDMQKAVERQKESGGRLIGILVEDGYTTAEKIQEIMKFQITETLVQLFSWQDGKYEFLAQAVPIDKDIPIVVNTEHFLMEGLRFVDEWSTIKDRITLDSVFVNVEGFGGKLTEEERRIYDLADGSSDVVAISDATGLDSFQVSSTLLALFDKDAVADKRALDEAAAKAPPPKKVIKPIPGLNYILVFLVLLALAASVAVTFMFAENRLGELSASEEMDSLRLGIEADRYENGSYPARLDEADPWGNPYLYEAGEDGFTLHSAGPDGVHGTPDDIP
jgi:hypothetical protein